MQGANWSRVWQYRRSTSAAAAPAWDAAKGDTSNQNWGGGNDLVGRGGGAWRWGGAGGDGRWLHLCRRLACHRERAFDSAASSPRDVRLRMRPRLHKNPRLRLRRRHRPCACLRACASPCACAPSHSHALPPAAFRPLTLSPGAAPPPAGERVPAPAAGGRARAGGGARVGRRNQHHRARDGGAARVRLVPRVPEPQRRGLPPVPVAERVRRGHAARPGEDAVPARYAAQRRGPRRLPGHVPAARGVRPGRTAVAERARVSLP